MKSNIITLTGELGSGKSTIATLLTERLNGTLLSVGKVQRELASSMGISTLELNRLAETDPTINKRVDAVFSSLQNTQQVHIVDARLGWHFLPNSIKIKLIACPEEAARRVANDTQRVSEQFTSAADVFNSLKKRRESENLHFRSSYGVDIEDEKNYDYVVDTTAATPEEIANTIQLITTTMNPALSSCKHWLCSKNLFPTESPVKHIREIEGQLNAGIDHKAQMLVQGYTSFPIEVVRHNHDYFIFDGHKRVLTAIYTNTPHVPATIIGSHQKIPNGESALSYFNNLCDDKRSRGFIYDWEGDLFRFKHYPVRAPEKTSTNGNTLAGIAATKG